MKHFAFVTGVMKGKYTSVSNTGEDYDYMGISLYLGTEKGESVSAAWDKLASRHSLKKTLPDIPKSKVFAFEIIGDGIDVVPRLINDESEETVLSAPIKSGDEKYPSIPCKWCGDHVPNNGGAQFSHLKKHINELVIKKFIDNEQAKAIRSVKLTPEIAKIFEEAFKRHLESRKEQ